ncbi:MAG: NTP transferase domain-containing protein [Vitreoscilla sp.]|nr:NTP transferase domain-containing protein [Polaromonas sp.]
MPQLPVVIVLAAGRGERFAASGGAVHKLQALLAGKRVMDHVLDAVKASGLPYHVVTADPARPGMGDSIAAGVRATPGANGWLILPADLPLISCETLKAMAFAPPCEVTVPVVHGQRGHPVRFGLECTQELLNLHGNQGAAELIRARAATESIAFIELDDVGCISDIDTLDDLKRAEGLLASR